MSKPRDLRDAGWIEDYDFAFLARQKGIDPEPFLEPGLGHAKTIILALETGREAAIVWLAGIPRGVQVVLDYGDGSFHAEDIDALANIMMLDVTRIVRAEGNQINWCEQGRL
jgi:hypothetical protein